MDKIKAFFENKITKIVCWVLLALSTIGLIIGGAAVEEINNGVVLAGGIIAAISALIVFITERVKK